MNQQAAPDITESKPAGLAVAAPLAASGVGVPALTFATGMPNAAMPHAGTVKVSIACVTGALAKLSQSRDRAWLEPGVPWVGLAPGAGVATFGLPRLGDGAFAALPLAAWLIAGATWLASAPILPRRLQAVPSKG